MAISLVQVKGLQVALDGKQDTLAAGSAGQLLGPPTVAGGVPQVINTTTARTENSKVPFSSGGAFILPKGLNTSKLSVALSDGITLAAADITILQDSHYTTVQDGSNNLYTVEYRSASTIKLLNLAIILNGSVYARTMLRSVLVFGSTGAVVVKEFQMDSASGSLIAWTMVMPMMRVGTTSGTVNYYNFIASWVGPDTALFDRASSYTPFASITDKAQLQTKLYQFLTEQGFVTTTANMLVDTEKFLPVMSQGTAGNTSPGDIVGIMASSYSGGYPCAVVNAKGVLKPSYTTIEFNATNSGAAWIIRGDPV